MRTWNPAVGEREPLYALVPQTPAVWEGREASSPAIPAEPPRVNAPAASRSPSLLDAKEPLRDCRPSSGRSRARSAPWWFRPSTRRASPWSSKRRRRRRSPRGAAAAEATAAAGRLREPEEQGEGLVAAARAARTHARALRSGEEEGRAEQVAAVARAARRREPTPAGSEAEHRARRTVTGRRRHSASGEGVGSRTSEPAPANSMGMDISQAGAGRRGQAQDTQRR